MIKKYDVIALSATSGFIYKKNNNFKDQNFVNSKLIAMVQVDI